MVYWVSLHSSGEPGGLPWYTGLAYITVANQGFTMVYWFSLHNSGEPGVYHGILG